MATTNQAFAPWRMAGDHAGTTGDLYVLLRAGNELGRRLKEAPYARERISAIVSLS